jgi:hypothetical protein
MSNERKRHTADEKVAILRRHLIEKVPGFHFESPEPTATQF